MRNKNSRTTDERFWNRIKLIPKTNCWEWQGPKNNGYGRFPIRGKGTYAHRYLYEKLFGKLPNGKVLDHLCRHRSCVRPDHLQQVTQRQNILRGVGGAAKNALKTHCKYGHPFNKKNTQWISIATRKAKTRLCILCHKARRKRYNKFQYDKIRVNAK